MCLTPEKNKFIKINNIIVEIQEVKRIEKEIVLINSKKTVAFTKKWHITNNIRWLEKVVFKVDGSCLLNTFLI